MRSVPDINLPIARRDPDALSHRSEIAWRARHANEGWASCPVIKQGCVRRMSSPSWASSQSDQALLRRLDEVCAESVHECRLDVPGPLDAAVFDATRLDPATASRAGADSGGAQGSIIRKIPQQRPEPTSGACRLFRRCPRQHRAHVGRREHVKIRADLRNSFQSAELDCKKIVNILG